MCKIVLGVVDRIVEDVIVIMLEEVNVEITINIIDVKENVNEGDFLSVKLDKNENIMSLKVVDNSSQKERVNDIMNRLKSRESKFKK